MVQFFRFSEIEKYVTHDGSGLYEIQTQDGRPLKVGISKQLCRRLCQHRASRQKPLRLKPGGHRSNPSDVISKQSVLAKHLYYDAEMCMASKVQLACLVNLNSMFRMNLLSCLSM